MPILYNLTKFYRRHYKKTFRCILVPWGGDVVDPLEACLSPHCHVARSDRSRSKLTCGDLPEKNGPLASRLSWSLKITGTDMDRSATYD